MLPDIHHDFEGFQALAKLCVQTKGCLFDEFQIDMGPASWFDADMCAAFMAILCRKPTSSEITSEVDSTGMEKFQSMFSKSLAAWLSY
ncbi:MAG: hypothetical protein ACYDHG_11630 [Desulfomonilaceae bacterium]